MFKAFGAGHIGFSKTFEECVSTAAKFGFGGVAADVPYEKTDSHAEIRELLDKNGILPGGCGLPVRYTGSDAEFDADMEKLPAIAGCMEKIGETRCATWIMPCSDTMEYKENFEFHKKRLGKAARVLGEYGLSLGLEFVGTPDTLRSRKYGFIHDLDGLIELTDGIGLPNLGILIDCWHWDMAGQTYADFKKIPRMGAGVVMAHINDAPAGIPASEQIDSVRMLPGATGVIKIADFFRGLSDLGYDGPVYAEPFYAPLGKMRYEDAVRATIDAINSVWPG